MSFQIISEAFVQYYAHQSDAFGIANKVLHEGSIVSSRIGLLFLHV